MNDPAIIVPEPEWSNVKVGDLEWQSRLIPGIAVPSEAIRAIFDQLLPEVVQQFLTEHTEDKEFPNNDLGVAAQYAFMERSMGKLYGILWKGYPPVNRANILLDEIIAQALLAKYLVWKEANGV